MKASFMTTLTTIVTSELVFVCSRTEAGGCFFEEVKLPIRVESTTCESLNFTDFVLAGGVTESSLSDMKVMKATWRGQDCELTVVERKKGRVGSTWCRFVQEASVLQKLRSPYILYCFGVVRLPLKFYMVTENLSCSTLLDCIRKEPLTPLQMVRFALDIARALCFVHTAGYIHKCVTLESVLVISRDIRLPVCCKLTNFGFSRETAKVDDGDFGPDVYMPPEVLMKKGDYKPSVDTFSYGYVIWSMAAREEPFEGMEFSKDYRDLICNGKRIDIPPDCLPDLAAMIQLCWDQNPIDRPEFSQIIFILEPLFWQLKVVDDAHPIKHPPTKGGGSLFGRKKPK